MEKMPDQQFVEYIVKALVDNPDDVQTERTVDEMGVLIKLKINQADMGKVIGKEGRTAKALRTLLRVIGSQDNARINLKIVEPEGGRMMDIPNGEEASSSVSAEAEAPLGDAEQMPEGEESVSDETSEEKEGDESSML